MKIKIVTIIFYFFSFLAFSQQRSGKVLYSVIKQDTKILDTINGKALSPEMKKRVAAFFNDNGTYHYMLEFNKNESKFFKNNTMPVGSKRESVIEISVGNGIYYTDIQSKKTLHQNHFLGDLFIIEHPLFQWTLLQENKKIGTYLCYKAVGEKIIENNVGTFKKPVIAWYTLDIPVGYGPKNYNGLPGLILELQEGELLFKADRIELFNNKELSIRKPTKGKKLHFVEFEMLTKELFENGGVRKKN